MDAEFTLRELFLCVAMSCTWRGGICGGLVGGNGKWWAGNTYRHTYHSALLGGGTSCDRTEACQHKVFRHLIVGVGALATWCSMNIECTAR